MKAINRLTERVNRLQSEWQAMKSAGRDQFSIDRKRVELLNAQADLWAERAKQEMAQHG